MPIARRETNRGDRWAAMLIDYAIRNCLFRDSIELNALQLRLCSQRAEGGCRPALTASDRTSGGRVIGVGFWEGDPPWRTRNGGVFKVIARSGVRRRRTKRRSDPLEWHRALFPVYRTFSTRPSIPALPFGFAWDRRQEPRLPNPNAPIIMC